MAVVGGGLLGLATARALARRGREVVVLEARHPGHDGSGSRGAARIFRCGYDDPRYVAMAVGARRQWEALEAEAGERLLHPVGQVTFGAGLDRLAAAMAAGGARAERLGPAEVAARFPALAVDGPALYEPLSGVLAAERVLAVLAGCPGVDRRDGTAVAGLVDDGRRVTVELAGGGALVAPAVVLCAGPGTGRLLARAGPALAGHAGSFTVTAEQVGYVDAPTDPPVPVFVERADPWCYGLPVPGTGRVKLALHGDGPTVTADRFPTGPDPARLARLEAAARRRLPGHGPLEAGERCPYDWSPDGRFVADRVGRVVVGAGTSGHGFKFGLLLGELLADLATGTAPSVDPAPFALARLARYAEARARASAAAGDRLR